MLNLFLQPQRPPLYTRFDHEAPENNNLLLKSVLLETERLSLPVVGVIPRVQSNVVFSNSLDALNVRIPAGWDVWLYLVHANRGEQVFPLAETFLAERYLTPDALPLPWHWGAGRKLALHKNLCVR